MTPSYAAVEIARRLDKNGPANNSALGLGLHQQKLKDHAETIDGLCLALGIETQDALNQMASRATHSAAPSLEEADA